MKSFILILLLLIVLTFSNGLVWGQVTNGGFETASDPCDGEDFNRPSMWQTRFFAASDSNFTPITEHGQETRLNWQTPEVVIYPNSGQKCLVLSTDDISLDDDREWWAQASQKIDFKQGDKIEFYYFFGTFDYPSYSDYASFILFKEGFLEDPIHNGMVNYDEYIIGVDDVGAYGSMAGWEKFEYTFTADDANNFDSIAFRVQDRQDKIFKSYFAIDDVKLIVEPGIADINGDYIVNFIDFEQFLQHWNLAEPNDLGGCDFDNSMVVDVNDLAIFCDNWLVETN